MDQESAINVYTLYIKARCLFNENKKHSVYIILYKYTYCGLYNNFKVDSKIKLNLSLIIRAHIQVKDTPKK